MSTRRTRSRTGRKFGKDITNMVHLAEIPPSKQAILENAKPNKITKSSINAISLQPPLCPAGCSVTLIDNFIGNQNFQIEENEKMIDENTNTNTPVMSVWDKISDHPSRDPVYDYTEQIRFYASEQSQLTFIQEDYMKWQVEIDTQKRQILVSWVINIHSSFNLKPETLFLAIHLIDQYGYRKCISRNRYQLLGITCLFMAAKYEELRTPRMAKYLKQCEGIFTKEQLLCQQAQVLDVINFQINQIILPKYLLDLNFQQIFEEIQKQNIFSDYITDEEKQLAAKLCLYILQLTLVEYNFCLIKPKYLSPVIIYISLKIKNIQGARSKKILQMYQLDQTYFKQCFQYVNKLYKSRKQYKFMEINKKYGINHQYSSSKSTLCSYQSNYTVGGNSSKSSIYK